MPSESVERKLTAILAADVAGYSRLMGTDEAGTARALREYRATLDPIVARYGGRIVKTAGDGVLLEFPSIVSAVECALAFQNLMVVQNADVPSDRQMWFRIGTNLGDVLIDGQDILGDGVNIAARLESIAKPRGICISDDAYRQIQGFDRILYRQSLQMEAVGKQGSSSRRAYASRTAGITAIPRPINQNSFAEHGPLAAWEELVCAAV